ncbi:hypothetical protein Bca4012_004730 [Brassica carinata]
MLNGIRTITALSNLNSHFDSFLTSLISAILVSLVDCFELGWIWQWKGEMWEEWRPEHSSIFMAATKFTEMTISTSLQSQPSWRKTEEFEMLA